MSTVGDNSEGPFGVGSDAAPGSGPVGPKPPEAASAPAPLGIGRWGRGAGLGALAVGVVAVVVAAAGAVIGHELWPGTPLTVASPTPLYRFPSGFRGSGSGGFSCTYYGYSAPCNSGSGSSSSGSGAPAHIASISAKVDPGLVDVNSTFLYSGASGAGTGIVLTPDGEILTNNHVIDGATSISVTDIGNGKTYSASVVGYDSTHDIAVLQLKGASGLQTATLGDSSKATVGDAVVAIGNAGGQGGTPSSAGGAVTGLNQSIVASGDGPNEPLSGLIQVNADVQPGDSGGALVDSSGRVLGVTTAARAGFGFASSTFQSYAIPIDQAVATAHQIVAGQGSTVVHVGPTAFLGVTVALPDASRGPGSFGGGFGSSGSSGSSGTSATINGAQITGTLGGDPAARAGITKGDVITSLNGQTVSSATALGKLLVPYHPGNSIEISWTDAAGKAHAAKVNLASGPPA